MGVGMYGSLYKPKGKKLLAEWRLDPTGVDGGHVKIRAVRCGKEGCRACPHRYYAYLVNRWGEKYLGTCQSDGSPRQSYGGDRPAKKQTKLSGILKKGSR